jgi:hypothetical protein
MDIEWESQVWFMAETTDICKTNFLSAMVRGEFPGQGRRVHSWFKTLGLLGDNGFIAIYPIS